MRQSTLLRVCEARQLAFTGSALKSHFRGPEGPAQRTDKVTSAAAVPQTAVTPVLPRGLPGEDGESQKPLFSKTTQGLILMKQRFSE